MTQQKNLPLRRRGAENIKLCTPAPHCHSVKDFAQQFRAFVPEAGGADPGSW